MPKSAPKRKASGKAKSEKVKPEQVEEVSSVSSSKKTKKVQEIEDVEDSDEVDVVSEEPPAKTKGGDKMENGTVKEPAKSRKGKKRVASTVEEPEEVAEEIVEPKEERPRRGRAKKQEAPKEEQEKPKKGRAKKKEDPEESDEEPAKPQKSEGAMNKTSTKWEEIDFKCSSKNANGKTFKLKISSWNIGGLKSWIKKDCHRFLDYEKPDIICLQETKCSEEKLPEEIKELKDYKQYWLGSDKEGYAGVGILTKVEPLDVVYGIEDEEQDSDGRCITAEFKNYYVICVYVPNAGRKLVTLPKRLKWNELFKNYVEALDEKKPVIICGDMNVSHNEIDLARPKSNTKNAGFTQEERDGMTDFLGAGFIDTFRELYPDKPDMYTFWTYMANARAKNVGWRLDYFIVSERIKSNICDSVIRSEVYGSDHCPITLFLNI